VPFIVEIDCDESKVFKPQNDRFNVNSIITFKKKKEQKTNYMFIILTGVMNKDE